MSDDTQETVSDLALAASAIFLTDANSFALQGGKVVEIKPAKMKQLAEVMSFFRGLIGRMEPKQLGQVIDFVARRQRAAIISGKSAMDVDLLTVFQEVLESQTREAEIEGEEMVSKGIETSQLFLDMLMAVMEEMPKIVPVFTNLDVEEFGELDLAEATAVAGGIFMVNYRFFTQSLRPMLLAFAVGVVRKRMQNTPKTSNATSGRKQPAASGHSKTAKQ